MEDISQSNILGGSTTNHVDSNSSQEYIEESVNPEDLDTKWLRWKCLKCGYLYEGVKELKKCPKCGNENPDYFEDAD
jgi:rubrerythrin